MKNSAARDHHGDPELDPTAKEKTLELLASLLVSTLDGPATTADVRRALNGLAADDDAWQVRVAECCAQTRAGEDGVEAGPSAAAATQEWVCPMCETVNWAPDARKSLRRRPEESVSASLPSAQLRCACCGYGGGGVDGEGEEAREE